ncbi:MAG: hypothetical protein GY869_30905 [Planctomycetes bacterium]|nr:hypothetical protein [Planctomycetota bacterium]
MKNSVMLILMGLIGLALCNSSPAQVGTAFTYQGRLTDDGSAANGPYDLEFKLYDALTGGSQIDTTKPKDNVNVYEGYFTVPLDFGSLAFNGDARWLQIGVRPYDSSGDYTTLSPRHKLTPTPYALYAQTAYELTGGIGITGSGTANYIPKFLDAATLGDSAIFESVSGNVGIGTNSPSQELTVQGNVKIKAVGTDSNLYLNSTGMNESRIYFDEGADHRWAFERKGTTNALVLNEYHPSLGIVDVMYWDYTHGTVGIGTTTPSEQLDVNGHVNSSQSYKLDGETILSNPGTVNIFVGQGAGNSTTSGIYNSAMGYQALGDNTIGYYNVSVGHQANLNNQEGSRNTMIGFQAGRGNTNHSKDGNVFIGHQAGYSEMGDDKLYIDNSDTSAPLIYGDFASNTLGINGDLGIGTMFPANKLSVVGTANVSSNVGIGSTDPSDILHVDNYSGDTSAKIRAKSGGQSSLKLFESGDFGFEFQYDGADDKLYLFSRNFTGNEAVRMTWLKNGYVGIGSSTPERRLYVNGDAGGAEAWHNDSDARLKKNVATIENALQKVQQLRGVEFEWNESENHPEGKQIGFIGQETEKVIPEVVDVIDGNYSMQYAPLTALLVEAVKQQQKQIESLKQQLAQENQQLKQQINELKKDMAILMNSREGEEK